MVQAENQILIVILVFIKSQQEVEFQD